MYADKDERNIIAYTWSSECDLLKDRLLELIDQIDSNVDIRNEMIKALNTISKAQIKGRKYLMSSKPYETMQIFKRQPDGSMKEISINNL